MSDDWGQTEIWLASLCPGGDACSCLDCQGFPGFREVQREGHAGVNALSKGMSLLDEWGPLVPRSLRPQRAPHQLNHTQVYLNGWPLLRSGLNLKVTEVWCSPSVPGLDGADPLDNRGWVTIYRQSEGDPGTHICRRCRERVCGTMLTGSVSMSSERSMEEAILDLTRPGVTPTHVVR